MALINIFDSSNLDGEMTHVGLETSYALCSLGKLVKQYIQLSPEIYQQYQQNGVWMEENDAYMCVTKSFIERNTEYVYLYNGPYDANPKKYRFTGGKNQLIKTEVVDTKSGKILKSDNYDINQIVNFSDVYAYLPEKRVKMTIYDTTKPTSVVVGYVKETEQSSEITTQIINRQMPPFIYRYKVPSKYTNSSVIDTNLSFNITFDSSLANVTVSADITSTNFIEKYTNVPTIQTNSSTGSYGENKQIVINCTSSNSNSSTYYNSSFILGNIIDDIDMSVTGSNISTISYSVYANKYVTIIDNTNNSNYIQRSSINQSIVNKNEIAKDDYAKGNSDGTNTHYIKPQTWNTSPLSKNTINITATIDQNYFSRTLLKLVYKTKNDNGDEIIGTVFGEEYEHTTGDWYGWGYENGVTINQTIPDDASNIELYAYGAAQALTIGYFKNGTEDLDDYIDTITVNSNGIDIGTLYKFDKYESVTPQSILQQNQFSLKVTLRDKIPNGGGGFIDMDKIFVTLPNYVVLYKAERPDNYTINRLAIFGTISKNEEDIKQVNGRYQFEFNNIKITEDTEFLIESLTFVTRTYYVTWNDNTNPMLYKAFNVYNRYNISGGVISSTDENQKRTTNETSSTDDKVNIGVVYKPYEILSEVQITDNTNDSSVAVVNEYLIFKNYIEYIYPRNDYQLYVNNQNMTQYFVEDVSNLSTNPDFIITVIDNKTDISLETKYNTNKQTYIRLMSNSLVDSDISLYTYTRNFGTLQTLDSSTPYVSKTKYYTTKRQCIYNNLLQDYYNYEIPVSHNNTTFLEDKDHYIAFKVPEGYNFISFEQDYLIYTDTSNGFKVNCEYGSYTMNDRRYIDINLLKNSSGYIRIPLDVGIGQTNYIQDYKTQDIGIYLEHLSSPINVYLYANANLGDMKFIIYGRYSNNNDYVPFAMSGKRFNQMLNDNIVYPTENRYQFRVPNTTDTLIYFVAFSKVSSLLHDTIMVYGYHPTLIRDTELTSIGVPVYEDGMYVYYVLTLENPREQAKFVDVIRPDEDIDANNSIIISIRGRSLLNPDSSNNFLPNTNTPDTSTTPGSGIGSGGHGDYVEDDGLVDNDNDWDKPFDHDYEYIKPMT